MSCQYSCSKNEYKSDLRSNEQYLSSSSIIAEVMGSFKSHTGPDFFRPYFHYCLSSVLHCDYRFYINFFIRSSCVWFSYIYNHLILLLYQDISCWLGDIMQWLTSPEVMFSNSSEWRASSKGKRFYLQPKYHASWNFNEVYLTQLYHPILNFRNLIFFTLQTENILK